MGKTRLFSSKDWFTSARKSVMGQGEGTLSKTMCLKFMSESRAFPALESVIMGKPN